MAIYENGDTQMYYEEHGEGIPILLIHGWAIDHRFLFKCMEPIFEASNKSFRRIYVDVPGMGQSSLGSVRNGDDVTRVLIEFMEEIAPGEGFYICGNSFGSVVARSITARLGSKVKGLLLIAPAEDRKGEGAKCGINKIDEAFMDTLSGEDKEKFIYMHANLNKETYDRYRQFVYPSMEINETNDFKSGKFKGKFGIDINKAIAKTDYDGPTLILTAKNDRAVGYENQYSWLSTFMHGTYIVIDGAGHNIHVDRPEVFKKVVGEFIEEYL